MHAGTHARTQTQTQANVRDPPPAATPKSHAGEKDTKGSPLPLIIGVAVGGGVFCLAAGALLLWKCRGMQHKSKKLSPLPVTISPRAVVPEIVFKDPLASSSDTGDLNRRESN